MSLETARAKIIVEHDPFTVYIAFKQSLYHPAPLEPLSVDSRKLLRVDTEQWAIQDLDTLGAIAKWGRVAIFEKKKLFMKKVLIPMLASEIDKLTVINCSDFKFQILLIDCTLRWPSPSRWILYLGLLGLNMLAEILYVPLKEGS
jgi:hypothetical protein